MTKEMYRDVEKKYLMYILSIVLIVEVVAFAALMIRFGDELKYPLFGGRQNFIGSATQASVQNQLQTRQLDCVDTDNGAYYRTAGYVIYKGSKYYDNCVGSVLNEKYCDYNSKGELVLKTHNYRCKWGCEAGACN